MSRIMTSSQKAASALRRAEEALRNWQDDPDSPRADVDKMLHIMADLRSWVQGHVLSDIDRVSPPLLSAPPIVAETTGQYDTRRDTLDNEEQNKGEQNKGEQNKGGQNREGPSRN